MIVAEFDSSHEQLSNITPLKSTKRFSIQTFARPIPRSKVRNFGPPFVR